MFTMQDSTFGALVDYSVNQMFASVADAIIDLGATPQTAELCAGRAMALGVDYGISDIRSLIGIATLLGYHDAQFDEVPSVLAALSNERVPPHERVGRIMGSPAIMARIAALTQPGGDRRLKA